MKLLHSKSHQTFKYISEVEMESHMNEMKDNGFKIEAINRCNFIVEYSIEI